MADDTTQDAPPLRASKLALLSVAVMTLVIAALMFTLSFDALRQLAIEIGARPNFAWMAPVAIDIGQAAATIGLVELGVAGGYRSARAYCRALAVVTVLLSVGGNGYHAYQLAERNVARVAAGEDLGFIPQPAPIAAGMAMVFPLLWLGLLHMFTLMLRALREERAHATRTFDTQRVEARPDRDTEREAPVTAAPAVTTVALDPARTPQRDHATDELNATQKDTINTVGLPTQHVDVVVQATRNGWAQTRHGLQGFLTECTLAEPVKEVASMLIDEPHLKQVHVAQRLQVDRSTVCRRWKQFVAAAEDEGFTVPPLPQPLDADTETDTRLTSELQPA